MLYTSKLFNNEYYFLSDIDEHCGIEIFQIFECKKLDNALVEIEHDLDDIDVLFIKFRCSICNDWIIFVINKRNVWYDCHEIPIEDMQTYRQDCCDRCNNPSNLVIDCVDDCWNSEDEFPKTCLNCRLFNGFVEFAKNDNDKDLIACKKHGIPIILDKENPKCWQNILDLNLLKVID